MVVASASNTGMIGGNETPGKTFTKTLTGPDHGERSFDHEKCGIIDRSVGKLKKKNSNCNPWAENELV